MEEMYIALHEFAEKLLGWVKSSETKEDFLAKFNEESFEGILNHLGYCFIKINEISYNYLEHGTLPDERLQLLGFSIVTIAHKVGIWDGRVNHPIYFYSEFAKGHLTEEVARGILKNQKTIEEFSKKIYFLWTEVHKRGVFTEFKKAS